MAIVEFAHNLWLVSNWTIVLADKKSLTRVLQTKSIPPSFWNAFDFVLQFNFKKAHIADSVNTAVDLLSRLELKVTERIHLKIREDVQTTPIEVITSSSDVADEEQFFFTQTDGQDETEQQILQRTTQSQKKAAEWVINQEPSSMKPSIKQFTKIDGNTTSYSINGIKAKTRIRAEQDADLVLKNLNSNYLANCMTVRYWQRTDNLSTTKRTRIALTSKMDSYSGNTTDKLVTSKTTNFSYQSRLLLKYSGVSTENLGNILEVSKQ